LSSKDTQNDIMVQHDMPALTVTENMVLKFLQTLKTDKSPGPDTSKIIKGIVWNYCKSIMYNI
jgi:hypothetical protein